MQKISIVCPKCHCRYFIIVFYSCRFYIDGNKITIYFQCDIRIAAAKHCIVF